jgi:hypothetical protein
MLGYTVPKACVLKTSLPEQCKHVGCRKLLVLLLLLLLCCHAALAQGALGVSWANGGDNQPEPPAAQDLSTVEAVLSALEEGGSIHASLLHLLDQQQPDSESAELADGSAALSSLQASREVDAGLQGSMAQLLQALHVFVYG